MHRSRFQIPGSSGKAQPKIIKKEQKEKKTPKGKSKSKAKAKGMATMKRPACSWKVFKKRIHSAAYHKAKNEALKRGETPDVAAARGRTAGHLALKICKEQQEAHETKKSADKKKR